MTWVAVGMTAISVVGSVESGKAQGRALDNQNIVGRANAAAETLMRDANNQLTSAQGALARYNQSVNNQRIAEQTGSEAEAALMNYRRGRDSAVQGDFESQIQAAEQAGQRAAAAATSGLVGGVADMVSGTSKIRESRIRQRSIESLGQADYDAAKQKGQIMRAGLEQMSTDSVVDSLDESITLYQDQSRNGNMLTDVLGGLMANPKATASALGGASSFFKTPGYDVGQGSAYGGNRKGL